MSNIIKKIVGTLESTFKITLTGAILKNSSGDIQVRNNTDSAFAKARCADPTADDDGATKRYVDSIFTGGGSVTGAIMYTLDSSAPSGWLLLNADTIGNAVSGATHAGAQYETLFDIIKNVTPNTGAEVFGDGDTVTLPDARGRFIIGLAGAGTGSTLGGTGGSLDHTHTVNAHSHTVSAHNHGDISHTHTDNHTHPVGYTFAVAGTISQLSDPYGTGGGRTATYQVAGISAGGSAGSTGTAPASATTGSANSTTGSASPATSNSSPTSSSTNPPYLSLNPIIKV